MVAMSYEAPFLVLKYLLSESRIVSPYAILFQAAKTYPR